MDMLECLYRYRISEKGMHGDKKYQKAKNQAKQYYQVLFERLSQKDREFLDKLISNYEIKTERKNMYCFKIGFNAGHTIAVKSLK